MRRLRLSLAIFPAFFASVAACDSFTDRECSRGEAVYLWSGSASDESESCEEVCAKFTSATLRACERIPDDGGTSRYPRYYCEYSDAPRECYRQ